MPQLDDAGESLLHTGQGARKRAKRAWEGFSDFALRDNVLEVAVGLMYDLFPSLFAYSFLSLSSPRESSISPAYMLTLTEIVVVSLQLLRLL